MYYQIRVKGHLVPAWAEWFDNLLISNEDNGEALLSGPLPDQAALVGVLNRLHSLNLTVVSVRSVPEATDPPPFSSLDE